MARTVLDEFTVTNTIRRDGRVAAQNTLVLSPDGTEAVIVFVTFNEKGVARVGSIVYYEKPRRRCEARPGPSVPWAIEE